MTWHIHFKIGNDLMGATINGTEATVRWNNSETKRRLTKPYSPEEIAHASQPVVLMAFMNIFGPNADYWPREMTVGNGELPWDELMKQREGAVR